MILGAGAVWESESEGAVHGAIEAKRALCGQSGRWMGVRAKNHAIHRHWTSRGVIEGSAGIVHGRSHGWMLDRWSAGVLRLVLPMLQQSRYMLDRATAVLVRPSEVIVYVTGVILQSAGMLDRAHHTTIHAAPHGTRRHRGRGDRMINDRSRLFRTNLLHRSAHTLHRSHGLMMLDGCSHRIRRWLTYDRIDRSHRLHRSHRLGRAHGVLERPHRRRIGRSARPFPASWYRGRTTASAASAATAAAAVTLRHPTARVRMIHRRREPPLACARTHGSRSHMALSGAMIRS